MLLHLIPYRLIEHVMFTGVLHSFELPLREDDVGFQVMPESIRYKWATSVLPRKPINASGCRAWPSRDNLAAALTF